MSNFFESNAVRLIDLLSRSGFFYKTPILQRKYVWDEDEIQGLLEDIERSHDDSEQHYFIGSMVFAKDKTGKLLVIDGQQRLTTIILLLASVTEELRKNQSDKLSNYYQQQFTSEYLDKDGSVQTTYLLELNGKDDEALRFLIEGESIIDSPEYTVSIKKLIEAKKIIKDFLSKVSGIQTYMRYVLENVYVVRTVANDASTAFMIFESINNNHSRLQPEDLLKNLLLQSVNDKDYEKFETEWQKFIQHLMNKQGRYVVQISSFLKHYIMSQQGAYISKEKIFKWFQRDNGNKYSKDEAEKLLKDLERSAKSYRDFIDGKGDSSIKAMKDLRFKQAYIVLLGCMNLKELEKAKIHRILETIAFEYVITGAKTNELEVRFCKIAKTARLAENEPEKVEEVLSELRGIASRMREKFKEALKTFKYKSRGNKNKIVYLLNRLATSLDGADYSKFSIEHILPQSAKVSESEDTISALGNLTLVASSDNSALKNKDFKHKREIYSKQPCRLTRSLVEEPETGTINTIYDQAIQAFGYKPPANDSWTEKEIVYRTECMADLADYVWFQSVL